MPGPINTHQLTVKFGKYKGEFWTRVPISYLIWMVDAGHNQSDIAKAEIDRRGVSIQEYKNRVQITDHAIDRASLRCLGIWKRTRVSGEGLHTWINRMANEALASSPMQTEKIFYNGLKFVFGYGDLYPTLKSLMPRTTKKHHMMKDPTDDEEEDDDD